MNTRHLWTMSMAAMLVVVLTVGGSASGQEYDADSATVETCTGEPIQLSGYEKRVLDLHNWTRADYGLQPLCVHPDLTEAARAHSQEMLDGGYFGHESSDGGTAEGRLEGTATELFEVLAERQAEGLPGNPGNLTVKVMNIAGRTEALDARRGWSGKSRVLRLQLLENGVGSVGGVGGKAPATNATNTADTDSENALPYKKRQR